MRKFLCLVALGLALAPSFRAQQPAATCDELRVQLRDLVGRERGGHPERVNRIHEAARQLLRVCGDSSDPFVRYVASWVEKYDARVREFQAGRDGGALGTTAGTELAKGLTQAQ